jgi:hypothetical protein
MNSNCMDFESVTNGRRTAQTELYYFHRCFQNKQYACMPFRIQFGEITRKNPKERAGRREDEIENYQDAITDSVFVLQ